MNSSYIVAFVVHGCGSGRDEVVVVVSAVAVTATATGGGGGVLAVFVGMSMVVLLPCCCNGVDARQRRKDALGWGVCACVRVP